MPRSAASATTSATPAFRTIIRLSLAATLAQPLKPAPT
jgi:hypothetical protein